MKKTRRSTQVKEDEGQEEEDDDKSWHQKTTSS